MDSGSSQTEIADGTKPIRLRILNTTLLLSVVLGGLAFVRTLVDSLEMSAWGVASASIGLYGALAFLLLARRLRYQVRAFGFLAVLFVSGVFGLFAAGYLPAPILILVAQNILASVLFGRRATRVAFVLNLVALLAAGASLSMGLATVETTHFYDPSDLVDWLRVTAVFAVFSGVSVVSVDVLTRHLDTSVQEQAELLENLKGAMQLHEAAESNRRKAETRLREVTGRIQLDGRDPEALAARRLAAIAERLRG
ncbi:MAG: hypothetical protein WBG86_23435, partial [Polyangiales bacterium]